MLSVLIWKSSKPVDFEGAILGSRKTEIFVQLTKVYITYIMGQKYIKKWHLSPPNPHPSASSPHCSLDSVCILDRFETARFEMCSRTFASHSAATLIFLINSFPYLCLIPWMPLFISTTLLSFAFLRVHNSWPHRHTPKKHTMLFSP